MRFISGHNGRGQRKPRISARCRHCGGEWWDTAAELRGRQFCSTSCRDAFRRERASPDHPQYSRIRVECGICGSTFMLAPRRAAGGARYCSPACGNEARRRKGREKATGRHYRSPALRAKERDGAACRLCGFSLVVQVHHIVPKARGGGHGLGNLVTLCPNHHAMAHAGLVTEDDLLAALAAGTGCG